MKYSSLIAAAALLAASAAHAEGDAAAGEDAFRQCASCHVIADGDNVIAGRGKTGPNLFGLPGRTAGTYDDFRYGDSIVAAGEAGLTWDLEHFVEYMADPRSFLQSYLDDKGARSKMSFRLRSGAEDIWAYIESVSPPAEGS